VDFPVVEGKGPGRSRTSHDTKDTAATPTAGGER